MRCPLPRALRGGAGEDGVAGSLPGASPKTHSLRGQLERGGSGWVSAAPSELGATWQGCPQNPVRGPGLGQGWAGPRQASQGPGERGERDGLPEGPPPAPPCPLSTAAG